MSRLSVVRNLARGALSSFRLAPQGHRLMVRCLSDGDDSHSPFVQTTSQVQFQEKPKNFKRQKPSEEPSHLFVWPDVKEANYHYTESSEGADDGITATWDFKNNELDVEELAGLPGPGETVDSFATFEEAEEESEHRDLQDELQFGRIRALREQLTKELDSSEAFTCDERSSLNSVRENVDFMMQELTQISSLLNTLYPEQANSVGYEISPQDNVMGATYTEPQFKSWLYKHSESNVAPKEEVPLQESKETEAMSSEAQLRFDQEIDSRIDEMFSADNSSEKSTPKKPTECSPKTDGRQDTQPKEAIHTYRPFRTIEVPAPKPTRSLSSQAAHLQEEASVVDNPPMDKGYTVCAQLSESESRVLMRMALKQALHNLELGKNKYQATLMLDNLEESHAED